ncbi:Maf-like protein [bacterium]|nr:Maf-like protein [bacterium]
MTQWEKPIVLASSSARRASLLLSAGIDAIQFPPRIDDGVLTCGSMPVSRWVQTLAVLKAQHVKSICSERVGTVLAADTVCVVDHCILGQPATEEDARAMLFQLIGRAHEVYTGWCLTSLEGNQLQSGCEKAIVTIAEVSVEEIEQYLRSALWQGKAGGYNLSERIDAKWPITCQGDSTSVMGLPMERMTQELFRSCT